MGTVTNAASTAKAKPTSNDAKSGKPAHRMARQPATGAAPPPLGAASAATAIPATPLAPGSKVVSVVALLKRESGATLAKLISATGWLPHTAGAALTGLRKKGHAIERTKSDDVTCYRITVTAPEVINPA